MITLPNSPNDMPSAFHIDAHGIRNLLMQLHQFRYVSINWEMDTEVSDRAGETVGEWTVNIGCKRPTFARHAEITNALWYALTIADASATEEYYIWESQRREALDKLTSKERKLLGL